MIREAERDTDTERKREREERDLIRPLSLWSRVCLISAVYFYVLRYVVFAVHCGPIRCATLDGFWTNFLTLFI